MKSNAFKRYTALFLTVVLIGVGLLYLAGLLPQEKIHQNIVLSAAQFEAEGEYPHVFNLWNEAYKLDAFSESLIINHSYFMDTTEKPLSIIQNRVYRNSGHAVSCLLELAEDPNLPGSGERARYWLGFRAYVRPLLSVMPYQDIRGVLSLVFFSLMFASLLAIKERTGLTTALCFFVTILSMNPVVVSTSLQYSCCFLIAFAGICLVCRQKNPQQKAGGLFMVLGQAAMFFDFYTAPLITWGLPFITLLSIRRKEQNDNFRSCFSMLGATLGMWAIGYAGMWLLKMVLNTLFTDQNGFAVFKSFLYYTGITQTPEYFEEYTALEALLSCVKKVFTVQNRFALCVTVPAALVCFLCKRKGHAWKWTDSSIWGYAAAAALPLIWILCSRQASGGHAYFQYRTLAVSVFGALCFMAQLFETKKSA